MILACIVEFDDESDADWLRNKCFPAFESEVEEAQEEDRLDSKELICWWEIVDNVSKIGS